MRLYLYVEKLTPIHRLDPRTKLFLMLGSFVLALLFGHPAWVGAVAVLIVVHALAGGAAGNVGRGWPLYLSLTFFSVLLWAFLAKGVNPLYVSSKPPFLTEQGGEKATRVSIEAKSFDPAKPLWRVSRAPLLYGLSTGIKLSAMIAAGLVLLSTAKHEEIAWGLIRLGVPYPIGFAFSTALRLVPTLVGTGTTVVEAQRSRGLDLDTGGPLARARKYVPLLGPIFLTTLRSTNHFAMALESKGFGAKRQRTYLLSPQFRASDAIALAILAALLAVGIALKVSGQGQIGGLILPV